MCAKSQLSPMESFSDVTVVPFLTPITKIAQDSGPIWPNWETQVGARHCRNGIPFDKRPPVPDEIDVKIDQPLIWAGRINPHFGHYIAEEVSRILPSLHSSKTKPLLFGCISRPLARSGLLKNAPKHFLQLAEWFGLESDRIKLCTQNMLVSDLDVAPQAEQLINLRNQKSEIIISDEYIDLLNRNVKRNNLPPTKNSIVYVSRGNLAAHLDSHGAAKYLDEVLRSLGVLVFYPEDHNLADQLSVYTGAEQLIFAEGSAVHGLQLLGNGLSPVSILNRRKGAKMAEMSLRSRCHEMQYINAIDTVFSWKNPDPSNPNIIRAYISRRAIFDIKELFQSFSALGVNLASVWDDNAYRLALEEDLKSWITATGSVFLQRWKMFGDQSDLIDSLEREGLQSVSQFAKQYMAQA